MNDNGFIKTILGGIKTWVCKVIADATKDTHADWSINDDGDPAGVKNRPFWTETRKIEGLSGFTFEDDDTGWIELPKFGGFIAGAIYVVTFKCSTWSQSETVRCAARRDKYGRLYIGNAMIGDSLLWGEFEPVDTGESFIIYSEYGIKSYGGGTYTVSIADEITIYHKLPSEYLPDTVMHTFTTGAEKIATMGYSPVEMNELYVPYRRFSGNTNIEWYPLDRLAFTITNQWNLGEETDALGYNRLVDLHDVAVDVPTADGYNHRPLVFCRKTSDGIYQYYRPIYSSTNKKRTRTVFMYFDENGELKGAFAGDAATE